MPIDALLPVLHGEKLPEGRMRGGRSLAIFARGKHKTESRAAPHPAVRHLLPAKGGEKAIAGRHRALAHGPAHAINVEVPAQPRILPTAATFIE